MIRAVESLSSEHMCFALIHAFSRASLICHRYNRKATGASWLQFSKYAVIHGNQTQCFIGKEDISAYVA